MKANFPEKQSMLWVEVAKLYGAKGLAWIRINKEGINSPIAKFLSEDCMAALIEKMDGKEGDLLVFVADKTLTALNALGHIRLEAGEKLNLINKDEFAFLCSRISAL